MTNLFEPLTVTVCCEPLFSTTILVVLVAATTSPLLPDSLTMSLPSPVPTTKFADDVFAAVAKSTSTVFAVTVIAPEPSDVIPIPLAPVIVNDELDPLPVPVNAIVPLSVLAVVQS